MQRDEAALAALGDLPDTLEYTGEFGPELILFLPFCTWLSRVGLLKDRIIKTYAGMGCFYDDLECRGFEGKTERRCYVKPHLRPSWLPVKNEHSFDNFSRCALHHYPDLRQKFSTLPLPRPLQEESRPILVLHNKYNVEWLIEPFNYISPGNLDVILARTTGTFAVVYIRHGMRGPSPGYSDDDAGKADFDERAVLASYPQIYCLDDLHAAHISESGTQDLNTFKNVIYSRCYHFITVQGGGAHQIALFPGAMMAILHKRGFEENWAYANGYYNFAARIPPLRAICRNDDDLIEALPLFDASTVAQGRAVPSREHISILDKLSPWKTRDT